MRLKPVYTAVCVLILIHGFSYGQSKITVRIGQVIDGSWGENNEMLQNIKHEILALTEDEFNVRFPEDKTVQANWTLDQIKVALDRLLSDRDVDLILTLGSISSHEACRRVTLSKPVIAPFIVDAGLQELPVEKGGSGIENLNFVSVPSPIEGDIRLFREMVSFQKLAVLMNPHFMESAPVFMERMRRLFRDLGIEIQVIGVGDSVDEALARLSGDVEAVYVLPLPFLSNADYTRLADGFVHRKLPSFSYTGAERVALGVMAGLNRDIMTRIARRVALNVQRILLGDRPEAIPVSISLRKQLTINDATSRAIGCVIPWAVITEAELIGQEARQIDRKLGLGNVVQEAIAANLDLIAMGYLVDAGTQSVKEARSRLLPFIDLSGTYLIIDEDQAEASMGMQPERALSGSANATQLIFSEPAWANLSIQKDIQVSRERGYDQLKLDIAQQAVTGFLNVLRAKTFERIQQENLRLTRHNLELARVREMIGSAGPAEVFRWETQIALNRKSVIEANSLRNLAEIAINRLLHRPAEESFVTLEADLNDPVLITSNDLIFQYIENRQIFRFFREFMVERGFQNSPELAALDAAIEVQERVLRSASNRFWAPTIALQARLNNRFSEGGAGTAGFSLPPEFSLSQPFPESKDLTWNIAFNISYPLFQGGEKFVLRQKAIIELAQLRTERKAVAERIEQRIRSALHLAGASYAVIGQTRLAAEAAHKSLDVVQDSYSQGLVSIVELLDAQNAVMQTDQLAATAVYDFLIDLMEVERAIGTSNFLVSNEERWVFLEDAKAFCEERGIRFE